MAVDFISSSAVEISSPVLAADGYSIENLLNRQPFRAEYFVKPPIAILLKPKVAVNLFALCLHLKVGQNKVRGIQFDLKCSSSPETVTIGRVFTDKTNLVFKNNGFRPHRKWIQVGAKLPTLDCEDLETINIASSKMKYCSHVVEIVVRIIATSNSTIPCLGKVGLWASPCSIDGSSLQMVKQLLPLSGTNGNLGPPSSLPTMAPFYGSTSEEGELFARINCLRAKCNTSKSEIETQGDESSPNMQIPDEFIDPLTSEMMTQPITLPCGTNVDAGSLEEYLKKESEWGRQPNDPFTRVAFTSESFPRPNVTLKSKIDSFTLNRHEEDKGKSHKTNCNSHVTLKKSIDGERDSEVNSHASHSRERINTSSYTDQECSGHPSKNCSKKPRLL